MVYFFLILLASLFSIPAHANTCSNGLNPINEFVCPSPNDRIQSFQKTFVNGTDTWSFNWSADTSPAHSSIRYNMWFDNPTDDDMDEEPNTGRGTCRFHFSPSQYPALQGRAVVDRIKTLSGQNCPMLETYPRNPTLIGARRLAGWFMRRDKNLESTSIGLTVEFRMKIRNHGIPQQQKAIHFYHTDSYGQSILTFSPNCVHVSTAPTGSYPEGCTSNSNFKAIPWDTTKDTVYRFIKNPDNNQGFRLYMSHASTVNSQSNYIDGLSNSNEQVHYRAPLTKFPKNISDSRYEFAHITLGDHTSNSYDDYAKGLDKSGAMEVDYLRYVRGRFFPGSKVSAPKLWPESLPQNNAVVPIGKAGSIENGIEFDVKPPHSVSTLSYYSGNFHKDLTLGVMNNDTFTESLNPPSGTGIAKISGHVGYSLNHPQGINGNGDWTIELRAKVGNQHSDRGAGLRIFERMGGVSLVLSKNFVELALANNTEARSHPIYLDTSKFNTYRLVKFGSSPFVNLYVNNDPRPVIADFKLSAFSMNNPNPNSDNYEGHEMRLSIGYIARIAKPTSYGPAPNFFPSYSQVTPELYIDYLRWSPKVKSLRSY